MRAVTSSGESSNGSRRARLAPAVAAAVAICALTACGGGAVEPEAAEHESWAVTAWGERYEIFAEVDPLAVGRVSPSHTHVTVLDGFTPMTEGVVEIVLRSGGREQAFTASEPARAGIWNVEIAPTSAGEYELSFRVSSVAGDEEVLGGRVRVGEPGDPGGLIAPAREPEPVAGEPVSFLKEQQWRTRFATEWVERSALSRGAAGIARVRPPAGGEATLTAPVDGVLRPRPWPHVGEGVRAGAMVFELLPRVASGASLAALESEVVALETELGAATARQARLEKLYAVEAVSRRELDDGRARVGGLEARLGAARRDLAAARAARGGGESAERQGVKAPFAGTVAAVMASPGALVAAGAPLARVVRTDPVWLELELRPETALEVGTGGVAGLLVEGLGVTTEVPAGEVRVVGLAPEVDPARGTVTVLLETAARPGLVLGSTLRAEVLLPQSRDGVVVPSSAVVDDGGVPVVYVQVEGEGFARVEVAVIERQGERVLVEGLGEDHRLVTVGGEAIRRATLLQSGPPEGHVH